MRAVNLIPLEERRARSGPGRSGGAVYGVLAALLLALVLFGTHTATKASITAKQGELAQAKADTAAAQRQVDDLQAYTTFAALRQKRVSTVNQLASSRFDWAGALREVSRTVPARTWLSGLRATVNPSTSVEGGAADPLRQAIAAPAIDMQGCALDHRAVARLVADLRRIDGVQRVSLSQSVRESEAPADAGSAEPGGVVDPCADVRRPKFSLTVFFRAPAVPAAATSGATPVSTPVTTP